MEQQISPFLDPGPRTQAGGLAIIHLSRDRLQPLYLQQSDGEHDGYAEGAVLNSRFGSFPHSTLIDVPWGSQVRASAVDTGSRGKKRKRPEPDTEASTPAADSGDVGIDTPKSQLAVQTKGGDNGEAKKPAKSAVAAASGFIHILPPTPEIWTMSLPHRTQVVYTPDYSFILQRLRARPGGRIIEAGAGSGSFTHAAARAIFNGYPTIPDEAIENTQEPDKKGAVFSYEYHEQRFQKVTVEMTQHKLDGIVKVSHRDVYEDGFLVDDASPEVDAVFLDLPAPWRALHHLSRSKPRISYGENGQPTKLAEDDKPWISPLNPKKSVYICTFSPCIEQVTRTVSAMRRLGWVEIEMVEIANKHIQVNREKTGLKFELGRGVNQAPRDVNEAVGRLRHIEKHVQEHSRATRSGGGNGTPMDVDGADDVTVQFKLNGDRDEDEELEEVYKGKPWMQGTLAARPEAETKTHTSYLVFAILPREWSAEDEAVAAARWPLGEEKGVIGTLSREARKEEKRQRLEPKKGSARSAKGAEKEGAVSGTSTPAAKDP